MGSMSGISKQIEAYCLRYPSEASRAALRSELRQAQEYAPLNRWTDELALKRMRELQETVSTRTVILKFQRLRGFFKWQVEAGHRKGNPVNLKLLPKLRDLRAPQALTTVQVQSLLKAIPKATWHGNRDHLAVSLMLIHGFRISTIVGIDWKHLSERDDGTYLTTQAKQGVLTTRKLRPDVASLLAKFNHVTRSARC